MASALDIEMFGSDDEPVAPTMAKPAADEEMEDLFGEDHNQNAAAASAPAQKDDESRGTSPTPSVLGDPQLTPAERRARKALEYEEEEEGDNAAPAFVREADVPVPNIPLPRGSDGNHWIIRMPNFVKFDSQPFHPDTYRGPEADLDEAEQAESLRERSMSIKLEVENTIRWRWAVDEAGKKYRQSNSRIIRWSDGSMSLQLGRELFDVSVNVDTSARAARAGAPGTAPSSNPNSQQTFSQTIPSTPNPLKPSGSSASQLSDPSEPQLHQGLSYLVAQHHTAAILQVEAPITGFLSLRPTGMHSETHRKLVRAVGQKHSKVARLRLAPEGVVSRDPGAMSAEAAKAAKRKARSSTGGRRRGEADDEESDGEYEKARRRQRSSFSRGRSSKFVYSDDDADEPEAEVTDDDDDDDDLGTGDTPKKRRVDGSAVNKKGKARAAGTGDYEADDFIVEDEPSDAEEGGAAASRVHLETGEPDLLDKIDRDIEDQARRRRKGPPGHVNDEAADVDVESEEMDVSESGDKAETTAKPGSRAPTAPALDDDDAIPQASRKPGKKRIIIEDDEEE